MRNHALLITALVMLNLSAIAGGRLLFRAA